MKDDKSFVDGMMYAVQLLAIEREETDLAAWIIQESNIPIDECIESVERSGHQEVEMLFFLNSGIFRS